MAVGHGHLCGTRPVEGVLRVDIRAACDEQLHRLEPSATGGEDHRRYVVARFGVDVGAPGQRRGDCRGVTGAGGLPQGFVGGLSSLAGGNGDRRRDRNHREGERLHHDSNS